MGAAIGHPTFRKIIRIKNLPTAGTRARASAQRIAKSQTAGIVSPKADAYCVLVFKTPPGSEYLLAGILPPRRSLGGNNVLKPMREVRFNREQAKHLADTFRVVAIAQFGFFGYHGLVKWVTQWETIVWSAVLFVGLEIASIRVLRTKE